MLAGLMIFIIISLPYCGYKCGCSQVTSFTASSKLVPSHNTLFSTWKKEATNTYSGNTKMIILRMIKVRCFTQL